MLLRQSTLPRRGAFRSQGAIVNRRTMAIGAASKNFASDGIGTSRSANASATTTTGCTT